MLAEAKFFPPIRKHIMEYLTEEIKERMYGFVLSFRAELILISISVIILLASLIVFSVEARQAQAQPFTHKQPVNVTHKEVKKFIYVDIAGAVEYPDVYKLAEGTRLKDLVEKAGGLSVDADVSGIAQAMNMSTILSDQQKIYMPKKGDRVGRAAEIESADGDSKIAINTATVDELDSLSGIGEATVKKIIAARPYKSISELLTKKIIGKNLYEKIKDSLTI